MNKNGIFFDVKFTEAMNNARKAQANGQDDFQWARDFFRDPAPEKSETTCTIRGNTFPCETITEVEFIVNPEHD